MNMKGLMTAIFTVVMLCLNISAQTTAFTYQGSLQSSGLSANGSYDFELKLFDAATGGTQIGSTLQKLNVPVANGIFVVSLDFGAAALPGADRFIEIGVRVNGNPGGFQQLLPRQPLTSTPYAVRSLRSTTADTATNATNSDQLGGVAANQYVVTTDPRLTDARNPTAGSANYIQNQNAAPQASSNFNISGNGTAGGTLSGNAVNSATQYNIVGNRVLSIPGYPDLTHLFLGIDAGASISANSGYNTFVGTRAGQNTSTGSYNVFVGHEAGRFHTTGFANVFIGQSTGVNNMTGSRNTLIGNLASVSSTDLSNASAIGSNAFVNASNSMVLGSIAGINATNDNTKVGIGTTTPIANLHVQNGGTSAGRIQVGDATTTVADRIITFGDSLCSGRPCVYIGEASGDDNMEIRAGIFHFITGYVQIDTLGPAGTTTLCENVGHVVSTCSSSLRYKKNISPFASGLSFVNKLRPISFDWKDGGMKDIGFGAEDIAKIDPRFVTYNDKGEVEGVKYDRLSVAFVNAFKEQQEQIETLQKTNAEQQQRIDAMEKIICSIKADAEICKTTEK